MSPFSAGKWPISHAALIEELVSNDGNTVLNPTGWQCYGIFYRQLKMSKSPSETKNLELSFLYSFPRVEIPRSFYLRSSSSIGHIPALHIVLLSFNNQTPCKTWITTVLHDTFLSMLPKFGTSVQHFASHSKLQLFVTQCYANRGLRCLY